ncbi:hypothetical protein KUCAC02_020748, partial [Chaenocephalus aceratus]
MNASLLQGRRCFSRRRNTRKDRHTIEVRDGRGDECGKDEFMEQETEELQQGNALAVKPQTIS